MDTIVPVMGQIETALLAISTALDDANHYTALTKLVDVMYLRQLFLKSQTNRTHFQRETGEPLFNVIRYIIAQLWHWKTNSNPTNGAQYRTSLRGVFKDIEPVALYVFLKSTYIVN